MPSFDLEAYCRTIQEHRVTFLYMVPPIVLGLSKSPVVDKYDLSSVKMGVAGEFLMILLQCREICGLHSNAC